MSTIDFIIVALLFASLWLGYKRGIIRQVFSLFGTIVAFWAAASYYSYLAEYLRPLINVREVKDIFAFPIPVEISVADLTANALGFIFLFFAIKIALQLLARLLDTLAQLPGLNFINKVLGALFCIVELLLILVVLFNIASIIPNPNLQAIIADSELAKIILSNYHTVRDQIIDYLLVSKATFL